MSIIDSGIDTSDIPGAFVAAVGVGFVTGVIGGYLVYRWYHKMEVEELKAEVEKAKNESKGSEIVSVSEPLDLASNSPYKRDTREHDQFMENPYRRYYNGSGEAPSASGESTSEIHEKISAEEEYPSDDDPEIMRISSMEIGLNPDCTQRNIEYWRTQGLFIDSTTADRDVVDNYETLFGADIMDQLNKEKDDYVYILNEHMGAIYEIEIIDGGEGDMDEE